MQEDKNIKTNKTSDDTGLRDKIIPALKSVPTAVYIICAASILVLIALLIIYLNVLRGGEAGRTLRRFNKTIKSAGYELKDKEKSVDGSITYRIAPTGEALVIFTDKNKFNGAALEMSGEDENSQARDVGLVGALMKAVYTDMDDEGALNTISELSSSGGRLNRGGYELLLLYASGETFFYIIDDEKIDNSAIDGFLSEETSSDMVSSGNNESIEFEAIGLIGTSFTECEESYGPSSTIVAENTRYYGKLGMTIVYDSGSDEIIYIDIDGSGSYSGIRLAEIYVGEDKEEADKYLSSNGVLLSGDDTSESGRIRYNGMNMELTLEYENGKVSLVSVLLE